MKSRNALAFSIAMLLMLAAHAAPPTVSFSDHWSSPGEPGWGVGISQQDTVLFVTFLLHDVNGQSIWYSATLTLSSGPFDPVFTFDGDVFATTGPWFAGPPASGSVTHRKAGTARFRATSSTAATLSFTVDGLEVTKQLTRLTLRNESVAGTYMGSVLLFGTCGPTASFAQTSPVTVGITQSGATATIATDELGGARKCTYTGNYVQHGQLAEVAGAYTCDTKEAGTFKLSELRADANGLVGRLEARFTSVQFSPGLQCEASGNFAAAYMFGPLKP